VGDVTAADCHTEIIMIHDSYDKPIPNVRQANELRAESQLNFMDPVLVGRNEAKKVIRNLPKRKGINHISVGERGGFAEEKAIGREAKISDARAKVADCRRLGNLNLMHNMLR
jgi:hypothetical protein